MRQCFIFTLVLCLTSWTAREAYALGGDHTREQLAAQCKTCVHGYWINQSDVFFHAGDARALNQQLAKLNGSKLQIVLHTGTKKARSPWDKADRPIDVDWTVTTGPMASGLNSFTATGETRVDIWLGGKIRKDDLTIPEGAKVEEAKP